jgi:demethylmenaquinone methyltransferase/2-methoxy-6-polyprenyl-1,4-benzoquinol methylase
MTAQPPVVEDMRAYYAQRAAYYERVYFKPERQTDLRAMEAWLPTVFAGREVLEIACGTGWWTAHGARDAKAWLATDLNPETMAVARTKALPACVQFETVDAYATAELGERTFDAAFAGCWWSHVPLQTLPAWLATLHARLRPGARVVMLDNSFVSQSSTPLTREDGHGNTYQQRTLDDGSVHEVLKNFPTAEAAIAMLGPQVRQAQWRAWEHYWALSYVWAGPDAA